MAASGPLHLDDFGALTIDTATMSLPGVVSASDWLQFAGKVSSVSAGAGLTLSGTGLDPKLTVAYGSTSTTAAAGNDSRLSDSRAPTAGSAFYLQASPSNPQAASLSISGNASAAKFIGDGSLLTSLPAGQLTGTIANARLAADVCLVDANNTFTGTQSFASILASGTVSGTFSGSGAGLSSLNASNVTSGTLGDALLSSNIPRLNGANIYTANQSFKNVAVTGTLSGNGSGLIGVSAAGLTTASSDPTCGAGSAGSVYFNTTSNTFFGCNGGAWTPFGAAAAIGSVSPVTFSTPGATTWTVPAGVTGIFVQVWGAGGAAGSAQDASNSGYASGGGGGGGYSTAFLNVVPGQQFSVSVGAGGTTAITQSGTAGGQSSFGNIAAGGGQGSAHGSASVYGPGGAGGAGNTMSGTQGGASASGVCLGGAGGSAGGLAGGLGGNPAGSGAAAACQGNGSPGQAPGGGGGGTGWWNGVPDLGGVGAPGQVVVSFGNSIDTAPARSPIAFTQGGVYRFTVPSGVTSITAQVWGAGGAGGGACDALGCGWGAGGGGGGGYALGAVAVTPGSSILVNVGTGGISSNGSQGLAGGPSSFGGLISAQGGNGSAVGSTQQGQAGATGGLGPTANGGNGTAGCTSSNYTCGSGGVGGGPGGAGGVGGTYSGASHGTGGANGQFPAGGGGGASWGGVLKGGNGADGAIYLSW